MLLIDKYAYTNRLANFNPMTKFIFVIGTLLIATILDNLYINLFLFMLMVFLTIFAAKIPWNKYCKLMVIPTIFLIISIVTLLLSFSEEDRFIWSIKIWGKYLGTNYESLKGSIKVGIRVLATISSTLFLGLTTPLNDIIRVLKKLKIPNTLIELVLLIYRFIFTLLEESKDIIMAQEMKFGYINMKNSYKSIALLIKCLFIRLLIRYKDMVISLDTKLYTGEFKIGD